MSANRLEVFDTTLQRTHVWLKEVREELGLQDQHGAYLVLRAVLHALRDHLTPEEAMQLGAQLPMLIRGFYYEGWNLKNKPLRERDRDAFLVRVYHELHPGFDEKDIDLERAVRAVFGVLEKHVTAGEIEDVKAQLPKALRAFWPSAA